MNQQIVLAQRPVGEPQESDFAIKHCDIPQIKDGEVLLRTLYLSLDPYMRGRMNDAQSYAAPVAIGQVMVGGTVSQVQESSNPKWQPGDIVASSAGWQQYAVSNGQGLRKLNPADAPISTALGVLGMPGLTAYVGLLDIGQPKPGETVVVSAASGAVGAVVGQIARIKGARVVGVAGSKEKLTYLRDELQFDAVVNHRSLTLREDLANACPKGIDVYFENVGGAVFDSVMPLFNVGARVPVCGMIAQYNDSGPAPGPDRLPRWMSIVLSKRMTLRGFIISDYLDRQPQFLAEMSQWMREGKMKYREDIVEGLENSIAAFRGLLAGKNFGKLLVRVAPDPTL